MENITTEITPEEKIKLDEGLKKITQQLNESAKRANLKTPERHWQKK